MNDWYGLTEVAALKVGDEVGMTSGNHYDPPRVGKVERRAATQVIIGGRRFNKYGRELGGSSWSTRLLTSPEWARATRYELIEKRKLSDAQNELRNRNWNQLTLDQCKQVLDLLTSFATTEEMVSSQDNVTAK